MPNWCDNQLSITGPNSVIDKIEKIVKEESNNAENGLLQFFHPMPKELLETEAGPIAKTKKEKNARQARKLEFGAENWYDWRVNNWGTKWEVCEFYGVDRQYLTEQNEGSQRFRSHSVQPGHHRLVLIKSFWRITPIVSLGHIIRKVDVTSWDYGKMV